jgi:hypothetical protein
VESKSGAIAPTTSASERLRRERSMASLRYGDVSYSTVDLADKIRKWILRSTR